MVRNMTEVRHVTSGSVSKARHSPQLQAAFIKQAMAYSERRYVRSMLSCPQVFLLVLKI